MAKATQAEMDAALKRVRQYFVDQGQGLIWDQVKSKIAEKLGIPITGAGDVIQFLPGGAAAQKLATLASDMLLGLYYYANQLVDPWTNPFNPKAYPDDYVKYLLYSWWSNDAKVGPAYKWEIANMNVLLGKSLKQ